MNLSKIQQEFYIRYYLWSCEDFKREIRESFPYLQLFRTGVDWSLIQFMSRIGQDERLVLANGLLKKFHPEAVTFLKENLSQDELEMQSRFRTFSNIPSAMDQTVLARELSGEKIIYASRNKLRKAIIDSVAPVLGTDIIRFQDSVKIRTNCLGWNIETDFDFGGMSDQVRYGHSIVSRQRQEPYGIPAISLGRFISLNSWLGLSSMTAWTYLVESDIEQVSDTIYRLCDHFIRAASNLLKGLEFAMNI
jgi:hypothetical protein